MTSPVLASPLLNAALVLAAVFAFLLLARHLILGAATDRDQRGGGSPRRPGPPPRPRPKVCPNHDCSAPNRPDANYCRRCGSKL
jgi:hypothetical protein